MEGRTTPLIWITAPYRSFFKHERKACISSSIAFISSSLFLCSWATFLYSSKVFRASSYTSSNFVMMMFMRLISDKSYLQSAIVADKSLFVPSEVVKKCVDTKSGHTHTESTWLCGPQTSLTGLLDWSNRLVGLTSWCNWFDRFLWGRRETPMNTCADGTPLG
jgi:hypothetical protein